MTKSFRSLLVAVFLLALSFSAHAAPMQVAAPARPGFFPAAAEIGQQIQELVTGDPNAEIEPQETFGTRALGVILNSLKLLGTESANFINSFAALPQLSVWYAQQVNDPAALDRWVQTGQLLILVVGGAFAAGWLADLVLLPLRRRIYRKTYTASWARFGGIFSWLILSLVPVVLFLATALLLIDQQEPSRLARYLVMTVVYALALLRLVRVVLRFFLAPRAESLRFTPISTRQAVYANRWISLYSAVAILGYFIAEMARVVKVPVAAISGFRSLLGLAIVVMTITVIVQTRSFVSTFIRGDLSAARHRQTLWESLRLWLARSWHVLAIAYLVIGYFVTMLGPVGGFVMMQQGTIGTLLVLLAMRMVFYLTARLTYRKHEIPGTSGIYRPVLRYLVKGLTWVFGALAIAASWGVDVGAILASPWGQRVLGSAFSIGSTILVLVLVYEFIHAAIERKLNYRDSEGNIVQADARSLTLLPMIRNAAIIILGLIASMVTLSELGINTAPLLAGAGVLGVALGFGSQTLVKDFLTGLFIIVENTIAVGDIVKLGEHAGVVEGMTIRTVRLRDAQGSLHIVPFSDITRIVNMSKGFAFALMDVRVSYDSDLNKVMEVMKRVGEELKGDVEIRPLMIEPIEIQGVENFADSAITVRARIKTQGGKQWDVRRAYMLRLKQAFDAEGIEIPFPHVVHVRKDVPEAT